MRRGMKETARGDDDNGGGACLVLLPAHQSNLFRRFPRDPVNEEEGRGA